MDADLNELSDSDKCSVLLNRVIQFSSTGWRGTWHVLARAFYIEYIISLLLVFPLAAAHLAQPILIRQIVLFLKDQSGLATYRGYSYALALFASAIVQAIIPQQIAFRNARIGMRIRNTLSSSIYKHLLTINAAAIHQTTTAQTINLMANDAGKFEEFSVFAHAVLLVPLETLLTFALLWRYIGLPTLFGYAVLALLVPIQFYFSRQFSRYRTTTMACTDKRLQAISELINGCQILKMYTWEQAMEQRVLQTRQRELSNIYKTSCLRALNIALSFATLPLISLATFGGSWFMGRILLPEDIFATLAFFAMVRVPVAITMPSAIEKFSEARVSARRIDRFMQLNVMSNKREKNESKDMDQAIIIEEASFSWKDTPSLFSLNLRVKNGSLVGVKGDTGAGKSTLLAAILGEINLVSGKLRLSGSSIASVPQSAWIFTDTIRANILLGKPMDEVRYKNVIQACCLDMDLASFGEARDLLMVADKGINLSGGQKARISLARALYTEADLYLLDDPLASVDPEVAKNIFEQCIGPRSLLREKTRILVTHQTQFLIEADQMILLTNGRMEELSIAQRPSTVEMPNDISTTDWTPNSAVTDTNSIVINETFADSATHGSVWLKLFTSSPLGWLGFVIMVICMLANEILYDFGNKWLALWSAKDQVEQRSSLYAYVYFAATCSTFLVALTRLGITFYVMLQGSTFFHDRMLRGMLYTSLRFFESNPSGRILNRASKDQQVLDESLPLTLIDTMQYLLMTLGSITIVGMTNPWVLLILIPLIPGAVWLRRFYIRSSRQIKRLESVTRSPMYTWFSSSLDGLTSIRAFNVQDDFLNIFAERIDSNARAYFVLLATGRWFGLRLDLMVSLLTLTTAVLVISLRHQIDPSAAALSISYCITLSGLFQWAVRQSAEAENLITSAERIYEYSQLPSESHWSSSESNDPIQPPNDWPSRGVIEFKDYTLRYRSELDPALKNLNLRIESREKVGVVGRTGKRLLLYSNEILRGWK